MCTADAPFLDALYFYRYIFDCVAQDPLVLPAWKGSLTRGVFGRALRRLSCANRRVQACADCALSDQCAYCHIFETLPSAVENHRRKFSDVPRPFIICPPVSPRTLFQPGEHLAFEITLFGRAGRYLPHFAVAFREMGQLGLGRTRGRFRLASVDEVSPGGSRKPLLSKDGTVLTTDGTRMDIRAIKKALPSSADHAVSIALETPLRLEEKGRLLTAAPFFDTLLAALWRRAFLLSHFHCNAAGDDLPEQVFDTRVLVARHDLAWSDFHRYSSGKKQKMPLGGLVGTLTYEGAVTPYLPLLKLGEFIHLGKHTVFGNGRFRILE